VWGFDGESYSTSRWWRPTTSIKKAGGKLTAAAVLFIILGISAIAEPAIGRLALATLIGWLLILGGAAHLCLAISGCGGIWQLILGTIYIIGGVFSLTRPLFGLGTLTLLLSLIFLAEGTLEFIAYLSTRNESGSVWLLVNGLVTLLIGGLISIPWNSSSVWTIGTLLGMNLMMAGFSHLMLGIAARTPATQVAGSEL
jgi:uncharacterized membrane protein HdeD (DUF308 family)